MKTQPLVTIGMPVRNGGKFLQAALDSLANQTYKNLQVIISDNCSDDQTADIINAHMRIYTNIQCVRQPQPLTLADNFKFVLDKTQSEFFMWAAHDDVHSADYVEKLVEGLCSAPSAPLAFGDLFFTDGSPGDAVKMHHDFTTISLQRYARMAKTALIPCYQFYGVWRAKELKSISFPEHGWWADLPILIAAAYMGPSLYVPGPQFYYYEIPKTNLQRVQYQDYKTQFNLPRSLWGLIIDSYTVLSAVGGTYAGLWGAILVIGKLARLAPKFLKRNLASIYSH